MGFIEKFYSDIIKQASLSYLIDENWIKAIIKQESNWDEYAIRYEPHYDHFYLVEHFAKKLNTTIETEEIGQKISWGLGQIMGSIARHQGFDNHFGELFSPEINIKHICLLIHALKKISPNADDVFAMYNGGPEAIHLIDYKYKNQAYVDSVKKHLQMYQNE